MTGHSEGLVEQNVSKAVFPNRQAKVLDSEQSQWNIITGVHGSGFFPVDLELVVQHAVTKKRTLTQRNPTHLLKQKQLMK